MTRASQAADRQWGETVMTGRFRARGVVIALAAGAAAVSLVADTKVTPVAAFAPKLTVAPLAKLVPVIVTAVPPAGGPDEGDTPLTVGTVL